ncbi:MAG: hypothetical protein HN802_02060 [Candidatus Jacksonbacteria bacterium]|nr:hypothetical protein [Candidatus Jacksonbacteria bacterium]
MKQEGQSTGQGNTIEGEHFWREQICRYQASGLSKAAFCRKHTLVYHRFHYWHQQLAMTQAPVMNTATKVPLIPVRVSAPPTLPLTDTAHPVCQLSLPGNRRLSVYDVSAIEPLLKALLSCS